MNISARCEYACRAVVELARNAPREKPMTASAIAERRGVPEKYLVHILLQLKRARIVRSVRGAQGGYLLAKSASDITLLDVTTAVDGPVLDPLPVSGSNSKDVQQAWKEVATGVSQVLSNITIQTILDSAPKADMYFI